MIWRKMEHHQNFDGGPVIHSPALEMFVYKSAAKNWVIFDHVTGAKYHGYPDDISAQRMANDCRLERTFKIHKGDVLDVPPHLIANEGIAKVDPHTRDLIVMGQVVHRYPMEGPMLPVQVFIDEDMKSFSYHVTAVML